MTYRSNIPNILKHEDATKYSVFKIIASAKGLYCRLSDIRVASKGRNHHVPSTTRIGRAKWE